MSYSWIPIYQELAKALLPYEDRQPELIAFLGEVKNAGLPVVTLEDRAKEGPIPLTVFDPFTFFASFNRGITDSNRVAILERIRAFFGLESAVPSDFDGIPTVDNQQSRFFVHAFHRKEGDVPLLWKLARQAVLGGREAIEAEAFDSCLDLRTVKIGKLSSGLFWLRPDSFLPVDRRSRAYLTDHGVDVPKKLRSWAQYVKVLDGTVQVLGDNFAKLSHAAFTHKGPVEELEEPEPEAQARRYWAGGHGEPERLAEFLATHTWSIGWKKDAPNKAALAAWARISKIQPGDWLAIKGYGGRNDLKVYAAGEVLSVDPEQGTLEWEPLDIEPFHGKAPGPPGEGSWRETLCEVTKPLARYGLFGVGERENELTEAADEDSQLAEVARPRHPLNLLLHGPPGTGKTYRMRAMKADFALDSAEVETPLPDLAELSWFEVVALALHDLGEPSGALDICAHPLVQAKYVERAPQTKLNPFVWQQLQSHTVQGSKTVNYALRTQPLVFDRTADGKWVLAAKLPSDLLAKAGNSASVTGAAAPNNQFFVTFHPSFTYEDFVEGLRPESDPDGALSVRYPLRAGVFKQACERAAQLAGYTAGLAALCELTLDERKTIFAEALPAVIFIDEINRGNVARIFGELITLIEPDKRLGADQELIVTLPGSQQRFGVPPNLWIVGTMNTADRSVVAVDIALRRRFAFEECPPDPRLLSEVIIEEDKGEGPRVEVAKLLTAINDRLQVLRDRDHLIGHSFFWKMVDSPQNRTVDELRRVFKDHIIPLLAEFFHDDLGRVGLVLGRRFVERRTGKIAFAEFAHDQREDFADRPTWVLKPIEAIGLDGFRAIYA